MYLQRTGKQVEVPPVHVGAAGNMRCTCMDRPARIVLQGEQVLDKRARSDNQRARLWNDAPPGLLSWLDHAWLAAITPVHPPVLAIWLIFNTIHFKPLDE